MPDIPIHIDPSKIEKIKYDPRRGVMLTMQDKSRIRIPGEFECGLPYRIGNRTVMLPQPIQPDAAALREQIIADIRATLPVGAYNVSMKQLAVFLDTTEKNTRRQIDAGALPLEIIYVGARKFVTITALTNYMVDLILNENEPKVGHPVKALARAKKMAEKRQDFAVGEEVIRLGVIEGE